MQLCEGFIKYLEEELGYEFVRIGNPVKGEEFLSITNDIVKAVDDYKDYRIIIKPKVWRAGEGEEYLTITCECGVLSVFTTCDSRVEFDNSCFNSGNYFHPDRKEEVQSRVDRATEIIKGIV